MTKRRKLWPGIIISGILFAFAFAIYSQSLTVLSQPAEILRPSLRVANPPGLLPVDVGNDTRKDLRGAGAIFIHRPQHENPRLALEALLKGEGTFIAEHDPLPKVAGDIFPSATYVLFAYRTKAEEPIYFRYRSLSPLLTTVWLSDEESAEFRLIDLAGGDAPAYRAAQETEHSPSPRILPFVTLPESPHEVRYVLLRIDTVFPVWSSLTLYSRHTFAQIIAQKNYVDGAFLGAVLAVMAFALYGLFYRKLTDYGVFLAAAAAMTGWFMVSQEFLTGGANPFLRRFSLAGPIYLYFILHGYGLWRLLYQIGRTPSQVPYLTRLVPLGLALAYALLGLLHNTLYAIQGAIVPLPTVLHWLNQSVFVIVSLLLILTVVLAPGRDLPGYIPLLLGESIGTLGLLAQWLRFNTGVIDFPILEAAVQYALPLEVLVWCYVLTARFNYLELIAKGRIKATLRRETKRATAALDLVVQNQEAALDSLQRSYQAATNLQREMLNIVRSFRHTAKNNMVRIGLRLEEGSEFSMIKTDGLHNAERELTELNQIIEEFAKAVSDAQQTSYPSASALHLLLWQIESKRSELTARNIEVKFTNYTKGDEIYVDGYHFMEAVREALTNVSRYAHSATKVLVCLSVIDDDLVLEVHNLATLREDIGKLQYGWPVPPSVNTENGETSHGVGLASIRELLARVGGSISCNSQPPATFVLTIRMPRRTKSVEIFNSNVLGN